MTHIDVTATRRRLDPRLRALLGFTCALVLVDTVFFTALTPLLPYYTHAAGLSKAGPACWSPPTRSARWSGRCPAGCSPPGWATGWWPCSAWA